MAAGAASIRDGGSTTAAEEGVDGGSEKLSDSGQDFRSSSGGREKLDSERSKSESPTYYVPTGKEILSREGAATDGWIKKITNVKAGVFVNTFLLAR